MDEKVIKERESEWEGYCRYLHEWSKDHAESACWGMSPACFDEWSENEYAEYGKDDAEERVLKVRVLCKGTYDTEISVPAGLTLDEAKDYALKHTDNLPVTEIDWVSDSYLEEAEFRDCIPNSDEPSEHAAVKTVNEVDNDKEATNEINFTGTSDQNIYRFNLKMPMEFKDYLQKASFAVSTASHPVSITEYICNLIAEDMIKNKEKK